MKLDWWIWRCDHYMIIFGLGIPAKHGQVGQAKPGFPHFADDLIESQQNLLATVQKALALDAASCSISRGEFKSAIELLEQGRAVLWSNLRGYRH